MAADPLLAEQRDYYRARAGEYDAWWQRTGRYDRGPAATAQWRADVATLERALAEFGPQDDVLELAAGTGWWSERLARTAQRLTCLDASIETLEINRTRLLDAGLALPRYAVADLFDWQPTARYDVLFFSFWLSHVPEVRFDRFWASVAEALAPGGRVFLIDSLAEPTSSAVDHRLPGADDVQERRLDDGRRFRIVKRFYDPERLEARLRRLGWQARVCTTDRYFLHAEARRL